MGKTYSYDDPTFLNGLVMVISENNCEFSAVLKPYVPEFILADKETTDYSITSRIPRIAELLEKRKISRDAARVMTMLPICKEHDILPFWSLTFDYSFNYGGPEMKFIGPQPGPMSFPSAEERAIMHELKNPALFSKIKKWHRILFNEVDKQEEISRSKDAIAGFIEEGYIVTYIQADLNPWIKGGGCGGMDYKTSDATLRAHDGEVKIYGNIDFDMDAIQKTNVRRTDTYKDITSVLTPKLLEKGN